MPRPRHHEGQPHTTVVEAALLPTERAGGAHAVGVAPPHFRPVVGGQRDDGVGPHAARLEPAEQPPDLRVGVEDGGVIDLVRARRLACVGGHGAACFVANERVLVQRGVEGVVRGVVPRVGVPRRRATTTKGSGGDVVNELEGGVRHGRAAQCVPLRVLGVDRRQEDGGIRVQRDACVPLDGEHGVRVEGGTRVDHVRVARRRRTDGDVVAVHVRRVAGHAHVPFPEMAARVAVVVQDVGHGGVRGRVNKACTPERAALESGVDADFAGEAPGHPCATASIPGGRCSRA